MTTKTQEIEIYNRILDLIDDGISLEDLQRKLQKRVWKLIGDKK